MPNEGTCMNTTAGWLGRFKTRRTSRSMSMTIRLLNSIVSMPSLNRQESGSKARGRNQSSKTKKPKTPYDQRKVKTGVEMQDLDFNTGMRMMA